MNRTLRKTNTLLAQIPASDSRAIVEEQLHTVRMEKRILAHLANEILQPRQEAIDSILLKASQFSQS